MTERRRPLENDDGQGSLFGGEAFAPAGPAPAWKRPARADDAPPASAAAPPSQAGVDAQAPPEASASPGLEPGGPRAEAGLAPPRGFAPGQEPAPAPPHGFVPDSQRPEPAPAPPHGFVPDSQDAGRDLIPPHAFEPGASESGSGVHDSPRAFEPGGSTAGPALDAEAVGSAPSAPYADELAELERATEDDARRPRAPLAGPTLDDVMSRVWEGLVTGLPAACPVCHGEVVPAISGPPQGRCSSCGTTID